MKLFLKNKGLQTARIFLLLIAGYALGMGIWVAFSPRQLPSFPIWIVTGLIIIIAIYVMTITE